MPSEIMTRSPVILRPDPARTVIRPFSADYPAAFADAKHPRAQQIADRILSLDESTLKAELDDVIANLSKRHRNVEEMLSDRFDDIRELILDRTEFSREQALLIGGYFSEEYSFESAALFNPSIVIHPRQEDVPLGAVRFAMSLRGIGEGHVSSVTFRTGIWGPDNEIHVDPASVWAVAPRIVQETDDVLIQLYCEASQEISETVLFPITPSQRQGIEDVRLVHFTDDDGTQQYLGTYTAFSGSEVRCEILHGKDFRTFEMRALTGSAAGNKGMALFPRRIGGRYCMIGRQDNENLWLLTSDNLYHWDEAVKLCGPQYPWEFIQIGNCGSPIEIDEGWLLITHGVGVVRNYCLGAMLLDKDDPAKLLARMETPILEPSAKERSGYVPNVVYSCGGIVKDRMLLLPYGVADSFTSFATVPLDTLLGAMCAC